MSNCFMYVRFKGEKNFRAFNYDMGNYAVKLIYCTIVDDTEANREKLQRLADLNKSLGMQIQLREPKNNTIKFQTL